MAPDAAACSRVEFHEAMSMRCQECGYSPGPASAACSRCGCIGGDECEHIDRTCWTQKNAATTKRLYWAGWWRFGSYNIGATKVLMLGPVRWFRRD